MKLYPFETVLEAFNQGAISAVNHRTTSINQDDFSEKMKSDFMRFAKESMNLNPQDIVEVQGTDENQTSIFQES